MASGGTSPGSDEAFFQTVFDALSPTQRNEKEFPEHQHTASSDDRAIRDD